MKHNIRNKHYKVHEIQIKTTKKGSHVGNRRVTHVNKSSVRGIWPKEKSHRFKPSKAHAEPHGTDMSPGCLTLHDTMDYTVHAILQARILEWVAFPFSRGSSHPSDRTQVSHIAGRFFTSWATREAQEHWSGWPIPSPGDGPNPGIELGSPALQADSLPTELKGKPQNNKER